MEKPPTEQLGCIIIKSLVTGKATRLKDWVRCDECGKLTDDPIVDDDGCAVCGKCLAECGEGPQADVSA